MDRLARAAGVKSAVMQATRFLLRTLAILTVVRNTGIAVAQPAAKTTPAQASAVVALQAIDAYEAEVEAVLSHNLEDADFEERERTSPHKAKLRQAMSALNKVSDKDLHTDLDILLEDANSLWIRASRSNLDPDSKRRSAEALAEFHSERDIVATEVSTGQRRLLLAYLKEKARKKAANTQ